MPHVFSIMAFVSKGKSMQQTGEHLNVLGKNPDCLVCKVNTFGATVSSTWSGDPAIWRSDWVETVKVRFVVFFVVALS